MSKTIVLVDYRWVAYRSAFRFNEFKVGEGDTEIPTGHIYGVVELVKLILDHYDNVKIMFCLDGKPEFRHKLLPSYKQHRHEAEPRPEIAAVRAYHDEPIKILSTVPEVSFLLDKDREADDIMSMMAFRELGKGNEVVVYTGDKDLLQLMQYGIKISKSIEEGRLQTLNPNYITSHADLGVAPEEVLFYRALDGDKSDDIPAALGGNKEFKREVAIKWHQSGDKYLENFDKFLDDMEPVILEMFKGKKAQNNNREKLRTIKEDAVRNMKLMELDVYKPIYDAYKTYKETGDKEALADVKEQFKLSNIKLVDYDMGEADVKELLEKYELQRHKAWMNYNNYI